MHSLPQYLYDWKYIIIIPWHRYTIYKQNLSLNGSIKLPVEGTNILVAFLELIISCRFPVKEHLFESKYFFTELQEIRNLWRNLIMDYLYIPDNDICIILSRGNNTNGIILVCDHICPLFSVSYSYGSDLPYFVFLSIAWCSWAMVFSFFRFLYFLQPSF